jgi:NADPH:quinone reductase-like Zn-dependent oxidoreductase
MTTKTKAKEETRSATTPGLMRAAAIDRFGGPDAITLHTLPIPEPTAGEVLIAVHAAGVGVWDADIREGSWATGKERFPLVLGTDGAGVIVAVGAKVANFHIGHRVWAYQFDSSKGGFYAEYVAVHAASVALAPTQLDLLQAGAGAVTGLTALQGIDVHLALQEGETVLIFGATGALGTLAVQFAKLRKAHVVGTATGVDAMELVRKLGADGVFDPRQKDGIATLRKLAPAGFDAALVLAGGETTEHCLDLVLPGGRIAYPNGVEPPPKRRSKIKVIAYDAEAGPKQWAALSRAVAEGDVTVPIADVFPLEKAAQAHARLEKGHVLGRIVLKVRDDQ